KIKTTPPAGAITLTAIIGSASTHTAVTIPLTATIKPSPPPVPAATTTPLLKTPTIHAIPTKPPAQPTPPISSQPPPAGHFQETQEEQRFTFASRWDGALDGIRVQALAGQDAFGRGIVEVKSPYDPNK